MEVLLYSEINILCIILLAIMAVTASRYGLDDTAQKRSFIAAMWSASTMNICEIFWKIGLTHTWPIPAWLMYTINCFYFMSLGITSFFWFVFSLYLLKRDFPHKRIAHLLMVLPLLILFVLLITTPFNGWLFHFDENLNQIRGPLYYAQHVLGFFFVLVTVIVTPAQMISQRDYLKRDEYHMMFSFCVPPVVCGIFQIIFEQLPIISIFPSVAFLLVYTSALKLQVTLDPLTGINNRRELLKEFSAKIKNVKKDKKIHFLFIDIDNFKQLNDYYGHHEGDRALQIVADSISQICYRTGDICARYGGDEFAMVCETDKNKDVSRMVSAVRKSIDRRVALDGLSHPVNVSIGYAELGKDALDVKSLIDFADRQMYLKKAKSKKAEAENAAREQAENAQNGENNQNNEKACPPPRNQRKNRR